MNDQILPRIEPIENGRKIYTGELTDKVNQLIERSNLRDKLLANPAANWAGQKELP